MSWKTGLVAAVTATALLSGAFVGEAEARRGYGGYSSGGGGSGAAVPLALALGLVGGCALANQAYRPAVVKETTVIRERPRKVIICENTRTVGYDEDGNPIVECLNW